MSRDHIDQRRCKQCDEDAEYVLDSLNKARDKIRELITKTRDNDEVQHELCKVLRLVSGSMIPAHRVYGEAERLRELLETILNNPESKRNMLGSPIKKKVKEKKH
ncbi:hypothetical protein [Francisella philomiragia]|uniref:Uncharacterized protein n=1 Tax=Francisella philomiragia TaxID=28110 RepID=A0A0B6D6M1_9GAMM|nr:hypothetical protein [Francisella philomiragia]AJI53308.1 hypothetical protein LA55_1261 [Francisella philomiragia]